MKPSSLQEARRMPTALFVLLVVVLWLAVGLGSALLFLGRRGFRDPRWYLLGAVLGPLFLPIAIERGRTTGRVLERTPAPGVDAAGPLAVLVGVDGSAESDQAVRDAVRLFAPGGARVVLAAVADPDTAEFDDGAGLRVWHDLLAERAGWFPPGGAQPAREVLCGRPDRMLLEAAETEGIDVLLVGRRGRGLSHRLLGSVAETLAREARCPVLLAGPATPAAPGGRGRPAASGRRGTVG